MSKIKFVQNKVYNYVKSKQIFELICETVAFGIFIPMITLGIINIIIQVATHGAPNINLV